MYYGSRVIVSQIDEEDFPFLKKFGWYVDYKGYVFTRINNSVKFLHRMIMNVDNPEVTVDHHDSNKLNNRKENLVLMSNKNNLLKSWHEQETRNKLYKPVQMIDVKSDMVIMEFSGVKEAAFYLYNHGLSNKINQGAISNACLGRCKTSCGYKWRWKELSM